MKQEFPKWVYKDGKAKIVHNEEEFKRAKMGKWKETPKGKK